MDWAHQQGVVKSGTAPSYTEKTPQLPLQASSGALLLSVHSSGNWIRVCCLAKAAGSPAWSSGAISEACAQDNYPQAHLSALWPQRSAAHPESGVSAVPQALPVGTSSVGFHLANQTAPQHLQEVCYPRASADHSLRHHNFFQLPKANSTLFQSSPL